MTGLDWTWGEGNRLEAGRLEAEWKQGVIRLAPADLELDGQSLQADCEWLLAELAWECRGASKGQDVKKLQRWMKALGLRAEWVEQLTAGQMRGALTVAQTGMEAALWKGQLELRNAELGVPELAEPVKIAAANVAWREQRLVMPALKASAGGLSWTGSYLYEVGAPRPHRLAIDADAVEMADLDRVLGPVWKGTGFLSRAMGIGGKKESGAAEIELRAKRIGLLENVRATVWRDGETVTITALTGEWRNAKVRGAGTVRLGGEVELAGTVAGLSWEGGTVESDWKLTGRGRVTAQGTARLTGGLAEWVSGSYKWESNGKVSITAVEGSFEGKKLGGKVTGPADGPVAVDFGELLKLRVVGKPFGVTVEGR